MKFGNIFYIFYVVLGTSASLLAIEFISKKVNSANGIEIPLILEARKFKPRSPKDVYLTLDPHLGYAHGANEDLVKKLEQKYSWIDGFAVYSKRSAGDLERPVILVLGGSTTDGVKYDHSWPEELSKLLVQRGIKGTVVNGGTGGYSTNQELLKLVRDGLAFKPDIIISYSGVNDRGHYGKLPFPMVHPYQRFMLEYLTRPTYSPLFPNTIYLMNQILSGNRPERVTATLGVANNGTLGKQYERNMTLMSAIARTCGATFYGIIQPNAYVSVGESGNTEVKWVEGGKKQKYVSQLKDIYGQINDVPARLPFVYSLISIFEREVGVYKDDGVHTTLKGDRIIAEKVLDLIDADLSGRKTTGKLEQDYKDRRQRY